GADGDISSYQRRTDELGLTDRVRFVGRRPVSDLHHYLRQADILVSPRSKGFNTPMKIYSYLDSGRVVLATRMQTHTQVLDDEIAYLVEATATDMASGLVELTSNRELRTTLADHARERVALEYTREAFGRKLNEFYDRLESSIQTEPVT
ncbi:MAG: glycosyltransferase, partial [Thermodesulfobacteriota bacterium]